MSVSEVAERPLTLRFWILTAVLTAVLVTASMWWVFLQGGQCLMSLSLLSALTYYMPLVFISLSFMTTLAVTNQFKGKINIYHMTYLYTILASLSWVGIADVVFIPGSYWFSKAMFADAQRLTPWWFAPSQEIARQIIGGGVPIPWVEYLPSIIWWWWMYALWALCMVGITAILRHQWVDVEQVPFPQTMVAYELARSVDPQFRPRLKSKEFVIGAIMGIAFVTLIFMIINFPWFPDIYGWRSNTCSSGTTYISSDSPFAGVLAFVGTQKNPLYVAIFYLAPLTILFNIWFWWVVLAVLCQIAYAFGYYSNVPLSGGCGRIYGCPSGSIIYQQPFVWQVFANVGLQGGIIIGYIIVNRTYLADTIRSAMGRQSSLVDVEKKEPFRYRYSWILCISTMILIDISFMACGMSFASASVTVLITIFYGFCFTRTWGLSGFWASSGFYAAPAFYKWIWPTAPVPITKDWSLSMGFAILPASDDPYNGWNNALLTTMASSRLASLTKTDQKNVFKIAIFVLLITPIFASVAWLNMVYIWGLSRSPQFRGSFWNPVETFSATFVEPMPAVGIWWPQAIAGVITAIVLTYLHARFVWFPFEPIGMLIGLDPWGMLLCLWQVAAVAWILKTLTLRIGGSKAYEEHGLLVAGGLIVGYGLAVLVVGIVGITRFFIPF